MKERIHLYVSRKNVLTWLMTLCLVGSAVTRIVFACLKGSGETQEVWSQIVLPVAATLLYVLIVLIAGKEQFYKTAIPVLLMAFYYAIRPHGLLSEHTVIRGMFYTCLLFYFLIYAYISSGKIRYSWLLFPLFAAPLATLLYSGVRMSDWHAYLIDMHILADILLFVGGVLLVFAIRVHPVGEYHPTWGDRSDGRRIRTEPPMNQVSPYIMVTRNTSTNFFAESFEITGMERYIRQKRREGLTNFGLMHILLAAYCRGLCKFPALNRFIAGQKIYSRGEDVQFCMTIKKEMTSTSPETLIKVHLSPRDTAEEVYNKVNKEIENIAVIQCGENNILKNIQSEGNKTVFRYCKFIFYYIFYNFACCYKSCRGGYKCGTAGTYPAVCLCFGKFVCLFYSACHTLCTVGKDNFCSVCF